MQKLNRVIISGGGTGGHIFPAIAIANQIKIQNPDAQILFVGAKGKMEMEKVPKAGYEIRGLKIAGLQRKLTLKNLTLPFKVIASVLEARRIIKEFKPQAAIGVGGYASAPLLYAASKMGVKTFLQEQNAFAGLTNKILGKKATMVFTAYPEMESFFGDKVKICGNPVRQSVLVETNRNDALKMFGLDAEKKTVLFVGGSLGARVLNQFLKLNYAKLLAGGYQVIWQAGASYYKAHPELQEIKEKGIHICAFIENMNEAYAASDIVVSRAGALAISELAQLKKASVLVPSPYVADDHQNKNAEVLANKNAAILVKENEVGDKLLEAIESIMKNGKQRDTLSKEISAFAMPNAASEIVKYIEEAL